MSTPREAVQLAVTMLKTGMPEYDAHDVLEVLEAALEQPEQEQEPVAWRHWLLVDGERFPQLTLVPRTDIDEPLYTHPPRRETEQEPKWRLSCGCPSQHGGIPAEWPETDREGNPAVAYGVVCERHWHEYGAKHPTPAQKARHVAYVCPQCNWTLDTRPDHFVDASKMVGRKELRNQCGETCERARLCAICARGLGEDVPETDCGNMEPVAWEQIGLPSGRDYNPMLNAGWGSERPKQEPIGSMRVRLDMGVDISFNRSFTLEPGMEFNLCVATLKEGNA
jgi:hypothetical protein